MEILFSSSNIDYVKLTEELLQDYIKMVNDLSNVGSFIGMVEKTAEEKELKWVRNRLEEKALIFSMIERKSNKFIGNIELMDPNENEAELGIAITKDMQEKGFGTEAINVLLRYGFDTLKLKRIFLKAYVYNDRAIHVYNKCGFKEYKRDDKDVYMEIFA